MTITLNTLAQVTLYLSFYVLYLRQGGYVMPGVCLSVCLSVCLFLSNYV